MEERRRALRNENRREGERSGRREGETMKEGHVPRWCDRAYRLSGEGAFRGRGEGVYMGGVSVC